MLLLLKGAHQNVSPVGRQFAARGNRLQTKMQTHKYLQIIHAASVFPCETKVVSSIFAVSLDSCFTLRDVRSPWTLVPDVKPGPTAPSSSCVGLSLLFIVFCIPWMAAIDWGTQIEGTVKLERWEMLQWIQFCQNRPRKKEKAFSLPSTVLQTLSLSPLRTVRAALAQGGGVVSHNDCGAPKTPIARPDNRLPPLLLHISWTW